MTSVKSNQVLRNRIYIQLLGRTYYNDCLHVHFGEYDGIIPEEAQYI